MAGIAIVVTHNSQYETTEITEDALITSITSNLFCIEDIRVYISENPCTSWKVTLIV